MSDAPLQVEFYVLKAESAAEAQRFVCRLTEKAVAQQQRVFILADAEDCQTLDELLWSYRPDSFLPHRLWEGKTDARPAHAEGKARIPVWIGSQADQLPEGDVIVNLSSSLLKPPLPARRVIETVLNHPEARQASRARFRQYREQGIEPGTVQIDARF